MSALESRLCGALLALVLSAPADPADLAETYAKAIDKLNSAHAARPKADEAALGAQLPAKAAKALAALLEEPGSPETFDALVVAGEAALALDLQADFARIREKLAASPEHRARLGAALSRERFLVRGLGVDDEYLTGFADVLELVLAGYDELFGFALLHLPRAARGVDRDARQRAEETPRRAVRRLVH